MPKDMEAVTSSIRERLLRLPHGEVGRVADRAQIRAGTLSGWRTGAERINPRLETLLRLADALDEDLHHLLGLRASEDDAVSRLATAREKHAEEALRDIERRAAEALRRGS